MKKSTKKYTHKSNRILSGKTIFNQSLVVAILLSVIGLMVFGGLNAWHYTQSKLAELQLETDEISTPAKQGDTITPADIAAAGAESGDLNNLFTDSDNSHTSTPAPVDSADVTNAAKAASADSDSTFANYGATND